MRHVPHQRKGDGLVNLPPRRLADYFCFKSINSEKADVSSFISISLPKTQLCS